MKFLQSEFLNPILRFAHRILVSLDRKNRLGLNQRIRFAGVATLDLNKLSFRMYAKYDDGIVDALYFKNRHYSEVNEAKLFIELARNADVIIDIGANTGLYSILAKTINPLAKVIAFEPYKTNANRLRKNLELNNISELTIVEKALGNSQAEIEFAVPEKDQICDVLSADTTFTNQFYKKWIKFKNVSVPQTTLDTFVANNSLQKLSLLKIDVENYETFVLQGSLKTLEKFAPIILIEIFVNQDKISFYDDVIKPLGYYCYAISTKGLKRIESLTENSDCRNFIWSKGKSKNEFLPFDALSSWVEELKC